MSRSAVIRHIFQHFASRAFDRALATNDENILRAPHGLTAGGAILDIGCDDGRKTLEFAAAAGATDIHGVETVAEAAAAAEARGDTVARVDLDAGTLPYDAGTFDVVVSDQVIEHVDDPLKMLEEAHRILRPGGHTVIATENLASCTTSQRSYGDSSRFDDEHDRPTSSDSAIQSLTTAVGTSRCRRGNTSTSSRTAVSVRRSPQPASR